MTCVAVDKERVSANECYQPVAHSSTRFDEQPHRLTATLSGNFGRDGCYVVGAVTRVDFDHDDPRRSIELRKTLKNLKVKSVNVDTNQIKTICNARVSRDIC